MGGGEGRRGEEEGGASGEKGLVGLDARAHRGWAWLWKKMLGLEEASAGTQGCSLPEGKP